MLAQMRVPRMAFERAEKYCQALRKLRWGTPQARIYPGPARILDPMALPTTFEDIQNQEATWEERYLS